MFNFNNINNLIENKTVLKDPTVIKALDNDKLSAILTAMSEMNASPKLMGLVKTLASSMGRIEVEDGGDTTINALCFFGSPIKGIGAMQNQPQFVIKEVDVSKDATPILTTYPVGGVIDRYRNIAEYNKSRQFDGDEIVCIIPLNNIGRREYARCDEYIMNKLPSVKEDVDKTQTEPNDSNTYIPTEELFGKDSLPYA